MIDLVCHECPLQKYIKVYDEAHICINFHYNKEFFNCFIQHLRFRSVPCQGEVLPTPHKVVRISASIKRDTQV